MNNFNENDVNRASDGKFGRKAQREAYLNLKPSDPLPYPMGARVLTRGAMGHVAKEADRNGNLSILLDDGWTAHVKTTDAVNWDHYLDVEMPPLKKSYSNHEGDVPAEVASNFHWSALVSAYSLAETAEKQENPGLKGRATAWSEIAGALANSDSSPEEIPGLGEKVLSSPGPVADVETPVLSDERCSRLARHFLGKAIETYSGEPEDLKDEQQGKHHVYLDAGLRFSRGGDFETANEAGQAVEWAETLMKGARLDKMDLTADELNSNVWGIVG